MNFKKRPLLTSNDLQNVQNTSFQKSPYNPHTFTKFQLLYTMPKMNEWEYFPTVDKHFQSHDHNNSLAILACELKTLTVFSLDDHWISSTESLWAAYGLWSTLHCPPSPIFQTWIFFLQSPVANVPAYHRICNYVCENIVSGNQYVSLKEKILRIRFRISYLWNKSCDKSSYEHQCK